MKEIQKLYIANVFMGLANTVTVIFTLFLLSHGITQSQIGLLFGFFMVVLAVFDIPTGAIADIFGHKASIVIGMLLQGLSCLLFLLFPTFGGFFIGMFVDGLGIAFQSGATASLFYELLKKQNQHVDFQKVYGKATTYMTIASIIASPLGSFLYVYSHAAPYLFAAFMFLIASVVIATVKWEFSSKHTSVISYFQMIGEGIRLTFKNTLLLGLVIIGSCLTLARLVMNQNILQPYQVSIGIPIIFIGTVIAGVSLFQSGVSFYSHSIYQKIGRFGSLFCVVIVPAVALISLSYIHTLIALPFFLLFYLPLIYRDTLFTTIGQNEVPSDKRSTTVSTVSFLTSISAGIALVFWGKILDTVGIHPTLLLLGVFCLVIGTIGIGIIILPNNKLSQSPVLPR